MIRLELLIAFKM